MNVSCPHCAVSYELNKASVGQKFYCTACDQYFYATEKDILLEKQMEDVLPQASDDDALPTCDIFDEPIKEGELKTEVDLTEWDEEDEPETSSRRSRRTNRIQDEEENDVVKHGCPIKCGGNLWGKLLGVVLIVLGLVYFFIGTPESLGAYVGLIFTGGCFCFFAGILDLLKKKEDGKSEE